MTKPINNVMLKDFDTDTYEIIENTKEVNNLQKVYPGCTIENDFSIVREKIITKLYDFSTAFDYFNRKIPHNYVNFNNDCSAYVVHEFILKCYNSEHISLLDAVPTVNILNGDFIVE